MSLSLPGKVSPRERGWEGLKEHQPYPNANTLQQSRGHGQPSRQLCPSEGYFRPRLRSRRGSLRAGLHRTSRERPVRVETLQCNEPPARRAAGHRADMREVAAGRGSVTVPGSLAAPVTGVGGAGAVLWQHRFE